MDEQSLHNEPAATPPEADVRIPILTDDIASIAVLEADPHRWRYRWLVLAVLAFSFLWNAGSTGLWDPWETHYGEVTQNMIESYDWVSPWWGFKEKIGTEPINGYAFMSKPIFIFWAEATFVKLIGYSDWAIRLPVAILSIFALLSVFITLSKLYDRRTGFVATLVMATAPQFVMIARQAQTDMPFVGTLTIAMMFLFMALFGKRERISDRGLLAALAAALGLFLFMTLPQFGIVATDLAIKPPARLSGIRRVMALIKGHGVYHVILYLLIQIAVVASMVVPVVRRWRSAEGLDDVFKDRQLRLYYLVGFYVFAGLATLGKGLLGFMLPGFILLGYLGITWEWRLLKRLQILRGLGITAVVVLPWYVAMFAKHGMAFYSRFFVHDHFNRLGAGVHEIDTGFFEHFIKWLGIGLFPWVVFVPFVFLGFVRFRMHHRDAGSRTRLLLFLWFFLSYLLFTLAKTKFHHYIFPALPPLAMLIGLWLVDFLSESGWRRRFAVVGAFGLLATLVVNLSHDTQHIRNLCTYKYDRPLPDSLPINRYEKIADDTELTWEDSVFYQHTNGFIQALLNMPALEYHVVVIALGALAAVGLGLMFFFVTRVAGLAVFGGTAFLLLLYIYQYYQPMLAPSWSQKYLFEKYYTHCTPVDNEPEIDEAYTPLLTTMGLGAVPEFFGATTRRLCKEQVISWLLTWRGETYYTYDTIIPINKEATQFEAYLKEWNGAEPFYVFMQNRSPGYFESKLNTYTSRLKKKKDANFKSVKRWKVEKLFFESHFFTLMKCTPVRFGDKDDEPEKKKVDPKDLEEIEEDVVP